MPEISAPLILIVEDEPDKRRITSRAVAKAGFEMIEATTAAEAFALLAQRQPDVIILDINLPDINGYEVCRRLKADTATCDIPVLYLTAAHIKLEDKVQGLEGGADGYLTFPFQAAELVVTVKVLLRLSQSLQAQKQQAHQWQTTFDAIGDPIVILDPTGRIVRTNQAFRRFIGKSEAEIIGAECYRLIHGADCFIPDCPFERARHSGQRAELEMQIGDRWFTVKVDPVCDDRGKVAHYVHVMVDITARRQSRMALKESEERLRMFIDASEAMIFLRDDQYRHVIVNRALANFLGATSDHIVGKTNFEFMPFQAAEECRKTDREAIEAQRLVLVEQKIGNEYYSITKFPVSLSDGKTGVGGIIRNVTERKRREAEILQNASRLSCLVRILEHPAPDIQTFLDFALQEVLELTQSRLGYIYFYDEEHKIFELNTWSRNVMAACSITEPQTRYELDKTGIWGEAVRQRRPILLNDFNASHPLKKGVPEGHAELSSFLTIPVFINERIVAVVGVANKTEAYDDSDVVQLTMLMNAVWKVVEQRQAQEQSQKLQTQLLQAQKMESIGRLAGGVAHDFNNQLSVIIGYAQMAAMKLAPDNPVQKDLEEINHATQRSAELTQQLLAFARQQPASPRVLNLNATISSMLKMLRRLIGEDIVLDWIPGNSPWNVRMDPFQMDQIMANLAVNARDAIEGVGYLTIATNNVVLDEAACRSFPDCRPGEYILLSISDTGVGIPLDIMDRIFDPFFTTKELGKGTGLGLATVYGIVNQNKGFIKVYSEVGKGTVFRIYLPRDLASPAPPQKIASDLPLGGFETILLVEDELKLLELTCFMLEQLGYTVLTASTPELALIRVQEYSNPIHLLITDLVMPQMNGRQLWEKLQVLRSDLKVLYVSGYPAEVIAHHGIIHEDVPFLSKPFSVTALAAKVRQVLESEQ